MKKAEDKVDGDGDYRPDDDGPSVPNTILASMLSLSLHQTFGMNYQQH